MATISLGKRSETLPTKSVSSAPARAGLATGVALPLPLTVVLVGLIAYPFVAAIVLSLQHKVVGGPATWVGFRNYRDLLVGKQYGEVFRKSVLVSFLYTGVAIVVKVDARHVHGAAAEREVSRADGRCARSSSCLGRCRR